MDDFASELDAASKLIGDLEVQTLLSGEYDHRDALVTIRSEAGGVDAADWRRWFLVCSSGIASVIRYRSMSSKLLTLKRLESNQPRSKFLDHMHMELFLSNRAHIA